MQDLALALHVECLQLNFKQNESGKDRQCEGLSSVIPDSRGEFLSVSIVDLSPFTARSRVAISGVFVVMVTDAAAGLFSSLSLATTTHDQQSQAVVKLQNFGPPARKSFGHKLK